jgi:hypothetical protein
MRGISDDLASLYAKHSDADPLDSHNVAMACRDLEAILGVGVLTFREMQKRHGEWFAKIESQSIPYKIEDAEQFAAEFLRWKAITEHWLPVLEHFERQGYEVEHAAAIRKFYDMVRLSDLDVRDTLAVYERLERGGGMAWEDIYTALKQANPENADHP